MTGRRVVVGVCGSIAAYKSAELVRRLREAGADVRVVMTAAATQFITPLTLQAVSGQPVRSALFDAAAEAAMGHIELARWADVVCIAPASADSLARLALGRSDDLLGALCLATTAPIVLAPAMNQQMWLHPATQTHVETLTARGCRLLGPGAGAQACGETGPGRMLEPDQILNALAGLWDGAVLRGQRVLITAGPTREALDPVRFLSNRSSGKMGYALAAAAHAAGAEVSLVSGPVALPAPPGVRRILVESAAQMQAAVQAQVAQCDIFIATAAVADYRPAQPLAHKHKRQTGAWTLTLEPVADILAGVAQGPQPPFTVGFAAETQDLLTHAQAKLRAKGADMLAANLVGPELGFDQDDNALEVIWASGHRSLPRSDKATLARELIHLVAERYHAKSSA